MRTLLLVAAVTLVGCVGTAANPDGGGGGTGGASGGGSGGGATGGSGGGSAGGSGGGSAGGSGGGSAGGSGGGAATGTLFETAVPWTQDISADAVSADSATIISTLNGLGGWGAPTFRTDDSIVLLEADAATPRVTVNAAAGYYLPDCETLPTTMPLPVAGAIEGETGYVCNSGGDCHILVISRSEKKLYEVYQGNQATSGGPLTATCLVIWDLTKTYTSALRGEQCTSADAAGLPITGLLPTPEEVFAGDVPHALRFILPNPRMAASVYVHPATHAGGPSGPSTAPPYGVRFRLKASFDENTLTQPGAKVLARALKKYGMILSDGGNIPITIASERFRTHTWAQAGITDSRALETLTPNDFEVVDRGPDIALTYNCVRVP